MIIIGNWKMNCLKDDALDIVRGIKNDFQNSKIKIVVCPPNILIPYLLNPLKQKNIFLGAQDCSHFSSGAHTGDISAEMLKDSDCSFVIVGHSERRKFKDENSEIVKVKAFQAIKYDLIPIICVGETLQVREKNDQYNFIKKQLLESLPLETHCKNFKIIIAYEPIWAIGTGKVASINEISKMHKFIRDLLSDMDNKIEVIYGGSVNGSNAYNILSDEFVDGVLVGGASINYNEFNKIISSANK